MRSIAFIILDLGRARLSTAARCAAQARDLRAFDHANARLTRVQRLAILGVGRLKSLSIGCGLRHFGVSLIIKVQIGILVVDRYRRSGSPQ